MAEEIMKKARRKSASPRKSRRKEIPSVVETEPKMKNPLISSAPVAKRFEPMLRLMTGFVLLLGGVILLAGLTGCKKDPQKAVDGMLQAMMSEQIKTFSATGNVEVNLTAKGQAKLTPEFGEKIKLTAEYTEKMDMNDWDHIKDWIDLKVGVADEKGNGIDANVELFEDDAIAYVKAKNIQGKGILTIPTEAMDVIRTSGVLNQWIKIDVENLLKQYGFDSVPMPKADAAQMKELFSKYRTKRLLIVSKDLGTKTIDGKKLFHFVVKIDQTQVEAFLQDYLQISRLTAQQAGLTAENKKILMDSLAYLNESGIEIFVGQKDSFLYGITLEMPFSYPEASGTIKVQQSYFDYNKTESLAAPTSFKTIEELIGSFMMMLGMPMMGNPVGNIPGTPPTMMLDQMKTQGMMQEDIEELMKQVPSGS